jgi:uncharacterized protein
MTTTSLIRSSVLAFAFVCTGSPGIAQLDFNAKLSLAALELTKQSVTYDPSYFTIKYPNGDVPADKGVCTDVIIRAYRKLGIDLQEKVHVDMRENFDSYPKNWGLKKTDTNIDHRRVPNLVTFFRRHGSTLPASQTATDYKAGDIVIWDIGGGTNHIGVVVSKKSEDGKRNLVVHNIGGGQVLADCLLTYPITGHFAYN